MAAQDGAHRVKYSFGYKKSADQDQREPVRHKIIVVGAGPVGLAFAVDLAQRGAKVISLFA